MAKTHKMTVTSIEDLVKASNGVMVELPPFAEGVPFVARLKRPSMLALVRAGKIPNALISTANNLFVKGGDGINTDDESAMTNLFEVLDALCEACFIEPTYAQLKSAGIELTDDQLMFVFNYTQRGVVALQGFRSQLTNTDSASDESTVPSNAE